MAQIHSLRTTKHQHKTSATFHPMSSYDIHGVKICQATFLFLHRLSRKRYLCIVSLYEAEGLVTIYIVCTVIRGGFQKNTCSLQQIEAIKTFVQNYARAHGLPVPGRLPNAWDKVTLLPSDMSKIFVHRKYEEASTTPVKKSRLISIWNDLIPHVAVMKPSSGLCFTCQQNNLATMKSTHLPETVRRQMQQVT